MKKLIISVVSVFALSLLADPVVDINTDRENAMYKVGEKAVFVLTAHNNNELLPAGQAEVSLSIDGGHKLATVLVDFANGNPAKVTCPLNEPGFIRAVVTPKAGFTKPQSLPIAAAAFQPEGIQPGCSLPENFMNFWEDGRRAIAAGKVELMKIEERSTNLYTSYFISVDVLENEKLYGFLTIPTGVGPFPVLVAMPGAGVGISEPMIEWGEKGVIALCMNVHKCPTVLGNEKMREVYDDIRKKTYYPLFNCDNLEKYHFRNVILGFDRAISYTAQLPQANRKNIVLDGSSQGGGLALIMAGFNPYVTAAAANVPAMCDHCAARFNRAPGWPRLISQMPESANIAPYYDVVNFARFINVPVLVSAGFVDTICPPSSVYAAFNQIKSSKEMFPMPRAGHTISKIYIEKKNPWIEDHLDIITNKTSDKKN